MIFLKKILIFLSILPLSLPQEIFDPDLFPRPLIIEINEPHLKKEVQLQCASWRVAVEANNLSPWKKIPEECGNYVRDYMTQKGYEIDLQRVSNEAGNYARSVNSSGDGKIAWIFDGLEIFDSTKFDEWVEMGMAPAIESSLKLYEEVLSLGFKVILLTGRSERHRSITVDNLLRAGFRNWDKLILRYDMKNLRKIW